MEYSKTEHKTHFISGANCYMFRHQSANIRELIINKGAWVQHAIQVLFAPTCILTTAKMSPAVCTTRSFNSCRPV